MKFSKQETGYSCGAAALRNCIVSLEKNAKSESYYRKIAKTDKNGTDAQDLINAIISLGYWCNLIQTKSAKLFERKLKKHLKEGGKSIVLIDGTQHWVAVIGIENKHVIVIDSDFPKIKTKQLISMFIKSAYNFDKLIQKYYYISINIEKIEEGE